MADEIQVTAEGYQRLQENLEKERQRLEEAVTSMAETRDDPLDLEDRGIQHAQLDLPILEARVQELEDVLARAVIVDTPPEGAGVAIGSVVVLREAGQGREMTVQLVSAVEVDALAGGVTQVSEDSPVGQALLGRKVGETFEVERGAGRVQYTVQSISAS